MTWRPEGRQPLGARDRRSPAVVVRPRSRRHVVRVGRSGMVLHATGAATRRATRPGPGPGRLVTLPAVDGGPVSTTSSPCRPCHPCPPMPPMAAAAAAPPSTFSGLSATSASVVSSSAATDAAFCSAERVTLAGSMTPALTRSSKSPGRRRSGRSIPVSHSTCLTVTAPSRPALMAIHLSGSSSACATMRAPVASSPSRLLATFSTAARLRTRARRHRRRRCPLR